MTRLKRDENTDRIFVANIEAVRRPPLGEAINDYRPALVLLQQANRAENLDDFDGYRAVGFRFSIEARGIKALVRDDVKVLRRKSLVMKRRWVGPKAGKGHEPRVYLAMLVKIDGLKVWVVDVHLPTRNCPEAQAESLRRLRKWALRRRRPVVIAGDFNMPHANVVTWASKVGGFVSILGSVDFAVSRGLKVRKSRPRLAPAGPYHGWGVIKFETSGKA